MQLNAWALTGIVLVAAMTFYLGHRGSRFAGATQDFLIARRTVRSRRNAAAISGEFLSAASFLGVAGIVLKDGADGLWYPIGFTAGYLVLMLFVSAPLRRSGAYTLPDFVEARLGSVVLRRCATGFVIVIGILYLVPQMQGAGLALHTVLPSAPLWIGAVAVTVIVAVNVLAGGMRAITVVQAFQYWLKLFAIAVPAFVLCAVFVSGGQTGPAGALGTPAPPQFAEDTTVRIDTPVHLQITTLTPVSVRLPGETMDRAAVWATGSTEFVPKGTVLRFQAGTPAPVVAEKEAVSANDEWLRPGNDGLPDLLRTYSLILATFLGTMGLPHVLVRFYTNPDGKAARRTAVHVLLLLGLFYLFPTLLGVLSRMYVPTLLVTGHTDAAVLMLPQSVLPGVGGQILTAIVMAGAFSAFLSTSSGLLVSVAGVVSTDVFKTRGPDFRLATIIVGVIPLALALTMRPTDLSLSVGISFALAASTFSPVLILGIWWRGLTWPGAMAGMIVGGVLVLAALVVNTVSGYTGNWAPWLAVQPALVTVPAAFAVTVLVSLGTGGGRPGDVNSVMLRLHAPDPLGFMRTRAVARFGQVDSRHRAGRGKHRR